MRYGVRVLATWGFSFAAAVFLSQYLLTEQVSWIFAAACAGLCIAAVFIPWKHKKHGLLVLLGLTMGFSYNALYSGLVLSPARSLDGQRITADAVSLSFPEDSGSGQRMRFRLHTDFGDSDAMVYSYDGSFMNLTPGDRVSFRLDLILADENDNGGSDYFSSQGVHLIGKRVKNFSLTGREDRAELRHFPEYLAHALRERIKEIFPGDTRPFALALITGDKSLLRQDVKSASDLQRAGIYHIATVSGMHVGVLVSFVFLIFGNFNYAKIIALPFLILISCVSGFTPSVVRACVMEAVILLAPVFMREDDKLTSLALALVILLGVNPFSAKSVGLQLSFASVLGIILFAEKIYKFISDLKFWKFLKSPRTKVAKAILTSGIATSLSAAVFTAPLSAAYFGYISLVSVITNLFILLILSPAFVSAVLSAVLGLIWLPLGIGAAWISSWILRLILLIAAGCSALYGSALYISNPVAVPWLFAVYCGLIALCAGGIKPFRIIAYLSACVVALCGALIINAELNRHTEDYSLAMLDVGQGQCLVLSTAGDTAVIDCGSMSRSDSGAVAAGYISGLGRSTVDVLILTHYDADHVNGASELMARTRVRTIIGPVPPENSQYGLVVKGLAAEYGARLFLTDSDLTLKIGLACVNIYGPDPQGSDSNDIGIAALISQKDFDVLVTGDMSGWLEERLARSRHLPDIECLVVGHHGSKNSTTERFLMDITPEVGLVSVGRDNSYALPSGETLERLSQAGVEVFRTDELGTLTVTSGGKLTYG